MILEDVDPQLRRDLDIVEQDPAFGTGVGIGHCRRSFLPDGSDDLGDAEHASGGELTRRVDVVGDRNRPPFGGIFIEHSRNRTERVPDLHDIQFGEIGGVRFVLLQLLSRAPSLAALPVITWRLRL